MAWAKKQAAKETELYKQLTGKISVEFSKAATIPMNERRSFNVGYLFLQKLCTQLRLDKVCRTIKSRHKFKYDLNAILIDLVYARILSPASKLVSYEYCQSLLEPPKYSLQDLYRSLSVIAEESDFIQGELYKNTNFLRPRNARILYYDCTNYYFEIEEEDDFRRYGKSKENRPNPIVTMGLFLDADGLPLAFDIFPGNQNEQTTLKPLESKILQDFNCSEFIYCSDSGRGSSSNRRFNSLGNRAYIITHSLKKMKKEDREIALNPTQFRRMESDKFIDIRTLDESDEETYNTIYYKEVPVVTGNMDETLIVTYSPKYKVYQRKIRARQIERAERMITTPGHKRKDRIKAHFMTSYISLLLYRLLEKKLGDIYTTYQILETLRSMQMTLLNTSSGYIPSYTRTELTDVLHKTFDFRTDYELITKVSMRTPIKDTKQIKSKLK